MRRYFAYMYARMKWANLRKTAVGALPDNLSKLSYTAGTLNKTLSEISFIFSEIANSEVLLNIFQ